VYSKTNGALKNDAAVLVRGRLEIDDGGAMTIIAEEIQPLDNIRERSARSIVLRFGVEAVEQDKLEGLYELLDKNRGECSITFEVAMEDGSIARIQPNQHVKVKVTPELTSSITQLIPDCDVRLVVERAVTAAR